LIGIAMSGPPLDAAVLWARQLYVLYALAFQDLAVKCRV